MKTSVLKFVIVTLMLSAAWISIFAGEQNKPVWRKGALHTHSLWSDGRSLPEVAVKIYKDLKYDFLCLSDHNIFQEGEMWLPVAGEYGKWPPNLSRAAFRHAQKLLPGKIIFRKRGVRTFVRLRTYKELRKMFEEKGKFLLIPGEEITVPTIANKAGEHFQTHFNTFNVEGSLPVLIGATPEDNLRKNFTQYKEKVKSAPEESFFMVNHPQARRWDIDPVILVNNPEINLFEICNNDTVSKSADVFSLEQFWDFILAHRLIRGHQLLYGTATDDAHFYLNADGRSCRPDLAWVMVNCPKLTAGELAKAINRGDFYSTCGVLFESLAFDRKSKTLSVKVKPEKGVSYKIRFIVTKKNFDRKIVYKKYPSKQKIYNRTLPVISDTIGVTALEVAGTQGSYTLKKDDLYVRALVISDKKIKMNKKPDLFPETMRAWTQPYCSK